VNFFSEHFFTFLKAETGPLLGPDICETFMDIFSAFSRNPIPFTGGFWYHNF
jgi:hypothetical protein